MSLIVLPRAATQAMKKHFTSKFPDTHLPLHRIITGLFALSGYTQELERLGRACPLNNRPSRAAASGFALIATSDNEGSV